MPSAVSNGARIRTNTPAENAYNSLEAANRNISLRQLRLSTGKRINSAADDVAGYITTRALHSRNGSLKAALQAVGDGTSTVNIASDGLDNINQLLTQVKDAATSAASGSIGTDEKVALAHAAYSLAQQIQTIVDSTVFGGRQLLDGSFSGEFIVGSSGNSSLLTFAVDLTSSNTSSFNVANATYFGLTVANNNFGGVSNLNLASMNSISSASLGIFSSANISQTLASLSTAINNVNKVAAYLGGLSQRLSSSEESLKSQITNYNAAISRIEDADVAKEQLELTRSQFLQQTSLTSLTQANQSPQAFLQLLRG